MKPPLNPSKSPQKILDFEFQRSLMRIPDQNQAILHEPLENPTKPLKNPKNSEKPLKKAGKPLKNDLRYSRGLSWSHDSEVISRVFAQTSKNPEVFPTNPNEIAINLNEIPGIPHKTSEFSANPSTKAAIPSSFFEKLCKFLSCCRAAPRVSQSELRITINELRSRESYEVFAASLHKLSRESVRKLRFSGLKSRFLIQYWRELEFLIREFPEICAIKFEATRLELEHCEVLLYFLLNKVKKIESLSLNFNGFHEKSLEFLFCAGLKLTDFPRLSRFSLKNNATSPQLLVQLQEISKKRLNFRYKFDVKSKKFAFLRLILADCELDDRALKKLTHSLSENHGFREPKLLDFCVNAKITERGWQLFASKFVNSAAGLQKLAIAGCNLSEHALIKLSEAVESNKALRLRELDLSDNANFTYLGLAVFVRKVLRNAKTLEILKMVRCGLNEKLVKGLCDGLWLDDANFLEISKENRANFK